MDFIKKPFVPDVLLLRVDHAIDLTRLQTDLAHEVEVKTREVQSSKIICPIAQIRPPTQNALKQFFKIGEFGVLSSTYD